MAGGFGTLEELIEIVTWAQLGIHSKPVGLLNVEGYYDCFLQFLDRAMEDGFIDPSSRKILITESDPVVLVDRIMEYDPSKLQGLLTKERWSFRAPSFNLQEG